MVGLCKYLFLVTVWVFPAPAPHPNHVSLAEIEFNLKTGNFEVALSVHPEDLEKELLALHAKDADAAGDFVFNERAIDRYAKDWLSSQFAFRCVPVDETVNSMPLPIRWVGCDPEVKKVWLFFEVKTKPGIQKFELENKVFLNINEDQTNHVKIKSGRDLKWLKMDSKTSKVEFELAHSTEKLFTKLTD